MGAVFRERLVRGVNAKEAVEKLRRDEYTDNDYGRSFYNCSYNEQEIDAINMSRLLGIDIGTTEAQIKTNYKKVISKVIELELAEKWIIHAVKVGTMGYLAEGLKYAKFSTSTPRGYRLNGRDYKTQKELNDFVKYGQYMVKEGDVIFIKGTKIKIGEIVKDVREYQTRPIKLPKKYINIQPINYYVAFTFAPE